VSFKESLNVYNRALVEAIVSKAMTFEYLEDMYGSIESLYRNEIFSALKAAGVLQKINQRQSFLSEHWVRISDYDLNLKSGYVAIQLNNGSNIKHRVGSLRKLTSETMSLPENHKLFLLAMGYLYVNAIDSICISRAFEAYLDEEI